MKASTLRSMAVSIRGDDERKLMSLAAATGKTPGAFVCETIRKIHETLMERARVELDEAVQADEAAAVAEHAETGE